ncbi:MAG: phosphate acyltransferase PlsX [Chloroflexota bacterium]
MRIAVDAAGGEYAPHEVVKGAIKAQQEYGVDIALVGRRAILRTMVNRDAKTPGLSIVNASQIVRLHDSPIKAIKGKPDSSILVGINLVKSGEADAFVSAGNTGAVVVAALLTLGKIGGIERPAIATILSITSSTPVLLIDSGANVDCRPIHLVQFAQMGSIYCRQVLDIKSPRVGLLSNGEEDTKGNRLTVESHQLLKKTDLNFIGNVEGQDIAKKTADVVVTDGFTGNVVLKTIEGLGETFHGLLEYVGQNVAGSHGLQGRLLGKLVGLGSWAKKLDYTEYGGACLLGVRGNVIIAHGRSQAKAIKNAIGLAKQTAESNVLLTFREEGHKYASLPEALPAERTADDPAQESHAGHHS